MKQVILSNTAQGPIRALHGVNCAPYDCRLGSDQTNIQHYFSLAHIPYSRLHDVMWPYGAGHYIDIPNIFPDFEKDENDPANYDFYYSDEYIGAIVAAGTQIVYRLGVSIEWGSRKYTIAPPKDSAKWARICEKIIAHYNEGWNNGFHYQIMYWEIWNEPKNPPMWTGTKEDFFALYRTASRHLKSVYPKLCIGGYGSCGFYAVTDPNRDAFYKSFVPYFTDFLAMCRQYDCPLDFYSWHIYTSGTDMLLAHAEYVRKTLNEYGFTKTESHLNEWNYGAENHGFTDKHTHIGASFLASSLIEMQRTGLVDKAMYYDFSLHSTYNGFLNQNDLSVDPPYWIFVAFGDLYAKGTQISCTCPEPLQALAAVGDGGGLLLHNPSDTPQPVQLVFDRPLYVCPLDETLPLAKGTLLADNRLTLPAFGSAYLKFDTLPGTKR